MTAATNPLLECNAVTVRFGGLEALSNLSLAIEAGGVLGIAGPNGAGKTTLFNVISGHVRASQGEVRLDGRAITRMSPDRIFRLGVARTFQIPEVIRTQSVFSNVLVGAHFAQDAGFATTLRFTPDSYRLAHAGMAAFELAAMAARLAGETSLFARKMVMLASAMARRPRLLLLDEPASGLTAGEADQILGKIRDVRALGTTVIVIEHVMRFLMAASDRLVILNRGSVLFDGTPEEGRRSEQVRRLYFGKVTMGT